MPCPAQVEPGCLYLCDAVWQATLLGMYESAVEDDEEGHPKLGWCSKSGYTIFLHEKHTGKWWNIKVFEDFEALKVASLFGTKPDRTYFIFYMKERRPMTLQCCQGLHGSHPECQEKFPMEDEVWQAISPEAKESWFQLISINFNYKFELCRCFQFLRDLL